MNKKSTKPRDKRPAAAVDEKVDLKASGGTTPPAHRALPEFLQTADGVESFMQKLEQKSNLNKKSRYAPFRKVSIENISVEDMRIGYRKLRALCFTNLTLGSELSIIKENYRKYFDADGKFVNVNGMKSLMNPDDLPPPKPLNSYILFCNEIREKTRKNHPQLTFEQLSIVMGKKWRELSREKRKEFDDEAERLKSQYETKLEKYRLKFPAVEKKKKERKRPVKAAKSASNLFSNGKISKGNNKVKSNDLVESDSDCSDLHEPSPKKTLKRQPESETVAASSFSPTKRLIRDEPTVPVQEVLQKSMPKEFDSEGPSSSSSVSFDSENDTRQDKLQNSKMLKLLTSRNSEKSRFDEKPFRPKSTSSFSSGSSCTNSDGEEEPIETAPLFPSPKRPFKSQTQPIKFEKSSSSSSSDSDDEKVGRSKNNFKRMIAPANFSTPDLSKKWQRKL